MLLSSTYYCCRGAHLSLPVLAGITTERNSFVPVLYKTFAPPPAALVDPEGSHDLLLGGSISGAHINGTHWSQLTGQVRPLGAISLEPQN